MESQAKRFLASFCVAVLIITTVLGVYNIIVDPYALFTSDIGEKIAGENVVVMSTLDERLTKSFDVIRGAPSSLILGSSAVDLGLDALNPAWPKALRPVYNLGMFSIDVSGMYEYLRHVLRSRHVSLVVLGVDFDEFLGRWVRPLGREEVARLSEPYPHLPVKDFLAATLSFDALSASTDETIGRVFGSHPEYIAGNHPIWPDRIARRAGQSAAFRVTDLRNVSVSALKPGASSQIEDLRSILELCVSEKIQVIVLINPMHAHQLEIYRQSGYWRSFEDWKRALVSVVAPFQAGVGQPGTVELWDFSGYDRYSTTELPQAIAWFWDPSHYTHRLGDLIVRRLFSGEDGNEFGMQLTPKTIEGRLEVVRTQQREYREVHRDAENELQRLYVETPH